MRMRVADAGDLSFVLEDQNEADVRMRREFAHLLLPRVQQGIDAVDIELGQRYVVSRAVADDPGHARGWSVAIDAGRRQQFTRCIRTDARVIVVEYESAGVRGIHCTADSGVSGTEITGRIERGRSRRLDRYLCARPGPGLPVCRHDDPLLTQRVPALFPHRPEMLSRPWAANPWWPDARWCTSVPAA